MHSLTRFLSASCSLGTGLPIKTPFLNFNILKLALIISAAAFSESTFHIILLKTLELD